MSTVDQKIYHCAEITKSIYSHVESVEWQTNKSSDTQGI